MWKSTFVQPYFKRGDPTDLNNYHPISKLPVLVKIFESQVNSQLKQYLVNNNKTQSGFRAGHSTITATMFVLNYVCNALEQKKHCAALFVDLTKAFDCVNHGFQLNRLKDIGISDPAGQWFKNYLTHRIQCVAADEYQSDF